MASLPASGAAERSFRDRQPPGPALRLAGVSPEPTPSASEAAEELARLLGASSPGNGPIDTPPGPPLPDPGHHRTNGRARWRCEHCGWEVEAWVRPECSRCYTMSTQAIAWVER